ncbi:MAG: hypothetical protein AB1797_08885 [bacterium]
MPTSLRGIAVVDAEARLSEEPDAGKLHAGICAGEGGNPLPYRHGSLPSDRGEKTNAEV